MAKQAGQKLRLLYVIELLKKQSNEDNPISAKYICETLKSIGIESERKAVYSDIFSLVEFGYDIIFTRTPKCGYFLASREFEEAEILLLADAVRAADFISNRKTSQLIEKLYRFTGYTAKTIKDKMKTSVRDKTQNEEIYYNIDSINRAINYSRAISLNYTSKEMDDNNRIGKKVRTFTVSPYALMWVDDHYYLICNNAKYNNLMHLRVDRISSVSEAPTAWRHFSEVSMYKDFFDTKDYVRKSFNMFGGEQMKIELRCPQKMLEIITERFSDRIFIRDVRDGKFSFSANALVSDGLISWILQYGNEIEVLSPEKLRNSIRERIDAMHLLYT